MELEQEKQLVEEAKVDGEAFTRLYNHYYPQIFGYVQRRTANIALTQDITSEVFFKVVKNIGQFQWRGITFSSWLFRIASNEITNSLRKHKTRLFNLESMSHHEKIVNLSDNILPEDGLIEAEAELQRYEEYLELQKNLAMLPVKYQEVISLRYFENKQIKEIGEILGKREGTVKSLIHRGLKKLQKSME